MRVAYLGPAPRAGGGVAGVAALLLEQLISRNHQIDCYVSQLETSLPATLLEQPGFILIDGGSRFRYGAWYSRTELTKFVSGQGMRAVTERRLARELVSRHRIHPYDLVYQFSHLEVFKLGGAGAPPLIVHPETHMAGELRWFDIERPLALQCEPVYRRSAARAILTSRTAVQRRHARLPAGFICPSRAFQRTFCSDYDVDTQLTRVVPNPIDLRSFRPRLDRPAVPNPVKVLFVSRISVRKGVETVVELSRRLADLTGAVLLTVVGDRSQWSDYRSLLTGLDPRIASYIGYVADEDMPALMADSDLLIQPSKYEPFGLAVGEALASGLPVVTTNEVGATEDVSGECARIVPVGDAAALEHEVRLLIREIQGGHGHRLALSARAEAERLFDPRRVGESLSLALTELAK